MPKKQYRLMGKIGVLDIIIVIVVIAAIILAFSYATNQNASASGGQKEISYSVMLSKKDGEYSGKLVAGSNVYDSLKGGKIGVLESFEQIPHKTTQPDLMTGKIVESEVYGLYDYILNIKSAADVSESTVAVGSYEVAVGKEMFIKSKNFASQGFCIKLSIGGQQ